ncbi:hypothetical protein M0R88_01445 [Halorussus gelatinilyticus]|uniref:Big-1 domain-containing protein n=1 Tax=Halorussus gelatinilyticus TaxID=2937524 RepID=A0A8U0IKD3_9EURY|nr:hypothetical protein [Halorussus gelatinilyticus]UPW00782.1 hypothetical protein M0R88_01445 [Halorussus gelatinilyticus]
MRLRTDERGVTVQIGTVLLFAVLVILLSVYQASVVPQQNEQVEFTHNQQVQSQLQDLRDELLRTATTGSGGSASVALGTRYPVRAFFVNPAPPSGTLRTTPPANLTIENATASGETGDYWTGSARNFSTRGLTYDPLYHVYQNPPTTVYDNGVLYNRFDSANRTLAGQRLVDGNTVSLVALNGSLSKSSSDTATVGLRSVSAATRTVAVRNETDENVTLVVPTRLPADEWEQLLAAEMNQTRGDDRYVRAVEDVSGRSAVRLVLEPATYELELAKVGVGTDVTDTDARYVTDVRGDNASVAENSGQELVVEVRDGFNNPVAGATVNATLVSPAANLTGDNISAGDARSEKHLTGLTTDAEGRVTIQYDTPDDFSLPNQPVAVRVSMDSVPGDGAAFAPGARANLSYNLTAVNTDGSGRGDETDANGSDAAYQTRWDIPAIESQPGMECYSNDTCRYDRSVDSSVSMTANTTPTAVNAPVEFSVNDTDVATFATDRRDTGSDGNATVDLDTATTGVVNVYAASGGSGDALAVEVYDSGGGGDLPGGLSYNDDGQATDSPTDGGSTQSALAFSVTNQFDQQLTITDVTVEPQTGFINRLNDPSGREGKWYSELYVEADVQNGVTDVPSGTDLPTTIDMDTDGHSGASVEAVLSSGSDATVLLYKFQFQAGFGTRDANMNGQAVDITLAYELADGTTGTVTFTVTG